MLSLWRSSKFILVKVAILPLLIGIMSPLAYGVRCEGSLRSQTVRGIFGQLNQNPEFSKILQILNLTNIIIESSAVRLGYASNGRINITDSSSLIQFERGVIHINEGFPVEEVGSDRVRFEIVAQLLEYLYTKRKIVWNEGKWIDAQRSALHLHFHHQVAIFSSHPDLFKLNTKSRLLELRKSPLFRLVEISLTSYKVLLPFLPPYRSNNPMMRLTVSEEAVSNFRKMKPTQYSAWVESEISKYELFIRNHQVRSLVRPFTFGLALVSILFTYEDMYDQFESVSHFVKPALETVIDVGGETLGSSWEAEITIHQVNLNRLARYIELYERMRFIEAYPEVYHELAEELPTLKSETSRLLGALEAYGLRDEVDLAKTEIDARFDKMP